MLSVWGEPVVSHSLDYSLLRSPCSNRTLRPNNHSHHSPSSSHTHSDTMASKSAVPSHLKADNGSDRHHGKTQSHVVCTEHSFFPISQCRFGAGKGGSSSSCSSSSRRAIGNRARGFTALEQHIRRRRRQDTAHAADTPDSGTSVYLKDTSGHVDASVLNN